MIGLSVSLSSIPWMASPTSRTITISGLKENLTHGPTIQSGATLTSVSLETFDSWNWQVDTGDGFLDIPGADQLNLTPVIGTDGITDLSTLRLRGTKDGIDTFSPSYTVRYAPPASLTALANQSFTFNNGVQVYDAAPSFAGEGLTFSVTTVPGVTVGTSTGIISLDTNVTPIGMGLTIIVSASNSGGSAESSFVLDIVHTAEIIVNIVPVVMSSLYAGQAIEDTTDFSTMTATGNFSSTAGSIVSAIVTAIGAADVDEPTAEGDNVGFEVLVTDDQANQKTFTASAITVQYLANVTANGDNELDIDINTIVPDGETISITVTGDCAGTYTPTAGALRSGAYNFGTTGLPAITGTTGLGDTLTAALGLWGTTTGNLTLTPQWQSDGIDISGATVATFDITAAEQGTDVTVEVDGDDGVASPVTAESAAISIPAGASGVTVTEVYDSGLINTSATSHTLSAADLTSAPIGSTLFFLWTSYDNTNNYGHSSLTFDGNSATLVEESATVNPSDTKRPVVSIWSQTAVSDRTGDIVLTASESVTDIGRLVVLAAADASATLVASSTNDAGGFADWSGDLNTVADGAVILASASRDLTETDTIGITSALSLTPDTLKQAEAYYSFAFVQTASASTPEAITLTRTSTDQLGAVIISLQPA